MKLKRLFLASFLAIGFISCSTTSIIPGQKTALELNIYSEYLTIADENFSLKNYEKAEIFYKKCLDCPEFYWEAYYKLGKTYIYNKKYDDALKIYEKILERDPENISIQENIAYLYALNSKIDEAIKMYEQLLEKSSDVSSIYENIIILNIQVKNLEQSEKYFSILKEKFPDCSNLSKLESEINKLKEPVN